MSSQQSETYSLNIPTSLVPLFVEIDSTEISLVQTEDGGTLYAARRELLEELLLDVGAPPELATMISRLELDEWRDMWSANLPELSFGEGAIRISTDESQRGAPNTLLLRPGRSFGIGHHATTRMCLELLCEQRDTVMGRHCLDFGSGSGVLGLAALHFGASAFVGIDNDPDARSIAEENLSLNRIPRERGIIQEELPSDDCFDLLFLNVLPVTQQEVWPTLRPLLHPSALVLVSGFLVDQRDSVRECLDVQIVAERSEEGWGAFVARLNVAPG